MNIRQSLGPGDASAIAPDTRGQNFWELDQALQDLLALYLPADLLEHARGPLARMGHMVANELDEAAWLADRHPPVLHHRDRFGNDRQWIEYHPAYQRLEAAAFGEFGMHAMSHTGGVLGWKDAWPSLAKHAFTYLFNQAEFGLGCPINVTDSGIHVLGLYGSEELKAKYLPRMLTTDMDEHWQGSQFMTEKEGGSDVGSAVTTARQDETGQWRLYGEKWFCSNADAEICLLLARPEGAGPGTRGLGLFLMPRWLDDGSANAYRIVRLKDKLGTRSMASGELVFEGALAYPVGNLERGFVQMAEMVNWSRLSNGVKSTALMRRAVHDAMAVMKGRVVFGSPLTEKPLARRQMLKIQLPAEQALSMCCFTADALDRAEGHGGRTPSQEAQAVLRLATPVLKFRATRDARKVAGDALEMRGGCGYIEDFANPRILRDAHLGSVWEGAGNVVALDATTRAIRKSRCHEPFQAALHARLDEAEGLPEPFRKRLRGTLDKAIAFAALIAASPDDEVQTRRAVSVLYHAATACLLAIEGAAIDRLRGDARRALWAKLVLDHRIAPQDPFAVTDSRAEDELSALLLGERAAPMSEVAPLLS